MLRKGLHEENRRAWDRATEAHNSHKRDQAAFLRGGGSTLFPEEIELLGGLSGLSLLHLQCNSGQDTLSLAQLGAEVTGVDISDVAIEFARTLSQDSGIPGTFHRSDIYDWLEAASAEDGPRFDVVFSSYGAYCWLSDLDLWAQGIASVLRPGGRFVLVDFHPLLQIFEEDWTPIHNYFGGGRHTAWEEGIGDYIAMSGPALAPSGYQDGIQNFANPHPSNEFTWTLSDIVTGILKARLTLEELREYPYANGCKFFPNMRETPGRRIVPPESVPELPLMFGLTARKPG